MTNKKMIRKNFRSSCFARDKNSCVMCGFRSSIPDRSDLDAHHITDRNDCPNGGYVKENGISLCHPCHEKAEVWHSSGHEEFFEGYHPDDLYRQIGSDKDLAMKASRRLGGQ